MVTIKSQQSLVTGIREASLNGVLDYAKNGAFFVTSIANVIAFFQSKGVPFQWQFEQSIVPSNVSLLLAQYGMKFTSTSLGLMHNLNARPIEKNSIPDFSIGVVQHENEFKKWRSLLAPCFGFSESSARMYTSLFQTPSADKNYTHVVGTYKGEVVSIGTLLQANEGGYLFNIATLPQHRKKGFASLVVQYLFLCAQSKNLSRVGLLANEESAQLFMNLGFKKVCTIHTYE